jgi:hypothetical protein
MDVALVTHRGDEKLIQKFSLKTSGKHGINRFVAIGGGKMIILKWMLKS